MNSHITHRTKRFEIFIYFVIIGFLFFPPNVSANKIQELTLEQKTAAADLVVIARVKMVINTEKIKHGARLSVLTTLKGVETTEIVIGRSPMVIVLANQLEQNLNAPSETDASLVAIEPTRWEIGATFLLFLRKTGLNTYYPVNERFGVIKIPVESARSAGRRAREQR